MDTLKPRGGTMQNVCEWKFKKIDFLNFVIRSLQNEDFMHFYSKKFGHVKKK